MSKKVKNYRDIRTLEELQHERRLLASRIDHQEIMVMYKLRSFWEVLSPANLLDMGCRAIASHSSSFNFIFQSVNFLRQTIKNRRERKA